MRLAIVGSQELSDRQAIRATYLIRSWISGNDPRVVISGGCPRGVDALVKEIAADYGYFPDEAFIEHLPKVEQWHPNGYRDRNLKIVMDCTHLVSIRSSTSTTYGSGWTADKADDYGRQVFRYTI